MSAADHLVATEPRTTVSTGGGASGLGLPFIDSLRSADALSRILGFPARPVRIRVKPGRSAIVAWQRDGAEHLGGWGWTAVLSDADKLANLRRRAVKRGETLCEHATECSGDGSGVATGEPRGASTGSFVLLSGGVRADPKLGTSLARAGTVIDLDTCTVVGYNPGRRILLRHRGDFVRVGTSAHNRLLSATHDWQRRGLPTLPVTRLGELSTAVVSPWWGRGDLAAHPDHHIAEAVGRTIAVLHRHRPGDASGTGTSAIGTPMRTEDALAMLDDTQRMLARVLPRTDADRVSRLASAITDALTGGSAAGSALSAVRAIHGDLSPDQVLVDDGDLRIIDLDRAGAGPVGMDLGRWVAACRVRDDAAVHSLEEAFLCGYRARDAAAVEAWTAWALLLTAIEPWRACRSDWREQTTLRLDLAEAAVRAAVRAAAESSAAGSPAAERPGGDAATGAEVRRPATIPTTIGIDGVSLRVRRAWSATRGRIAVELEETCDQGRGGIRTGFLDPLGGSDSRPDPWSVTLLPRGADPDLPGLARVLGDGDRLVSHRPGRRAVVARGDGTFAKCVRPGKAGAIIAGQDRAASFAAGFTLPEVLEADDSTVILSRVPGVELHDPGALGADWERAWTECLEAWARAGDDADRQRSGTRGEPDAVPIHSAADEARVLAEWRTRTDGLLGSRAARLDGLIAEVTAELTHGTAGAPTPNWGPVHRDLHDKQLMWDGSAGPGLLDVDTACLGEREIDLGNLSAHVTWRREQGIWTAAEADVVTRALGTITSARGFDPVRVRLYERATLLRLVCVYAFRPQWAGRTGALLDAAE